MPNRQNVMTGTPRGGTAGYLFRAPLGTPLPTNAEAPLDAAFVDMGYVSSDGVERAISKAYNTIRDMGGTEVLKVRNEHGVTVTLALLETLNGNTAKAVYGDSAVTVTPADASHGNRVSVSYAGAEPDDAIWVLDLSLGGKLKRHVWPSTQLTSEDSTTTLNSEDAATLPVTLTLYPDAAGNHFYEHSDDGAKVTVTTPAITTVLPAGRAVGGLVTISGLRLNGATAVSIGTSANFVVVNPTTIVATVPAGAAGARNVTVTTPAGTSAPVSYTVV